MANGTRSFEFRSMNHGELFVIERGEPLVAIGAYCLMPNHFHILLTPIEEGGVQTFMQKLTTGYSMYFNKKHERTGGLFEGRFKAEYANDDRYLKYLFSYIHLNPIKLIQHDWKDVGIRDVAMVIAYLGKYPFSSYVDRLSTRSEGHILDVTRFPEYFQDKTAFNEEIISWLTYNDLPTTP
jgi:putative transposase